MLRDFLDYLVVLEAWVAEKDHWEQFHQIEVVATEEASEEPAEPDQLLTSVVGGSQLEEEEAGTEEMEGGKMESQSLEQLSGEQHWLLQ